MATFQKFEDIEAWQIAREISRKVYKITNRGPFSKDFDLKSQIRKSTGSAMDNIAEGYERQGNKEFIQFLSIAKGSSAEFRSQLYRALDNDYITQEEFNEIYENGVVLSKKINSLMTYLQNTEIRGYKYKFKEN